MANFFAEDTPLPQTDNFFSDTVASTPINDQELDTIHKTNNPDLETPSSFGLIQHPIDFIAGLIQPILSLPSVVGESFVEPGELTQGMQGKSTYEVFKQSFLMRLADNIKEGDTGLLGGAQSLFGAEKDAILSLFSDGTAPKVMQDIGNMMVVHNQAALEALGVARNGDTTVAYDLGNAFGQVAITIGANYITKNPTVATAYMTALINSQDYAECRKTGKDADSCSAIAASSAYGQGLIEFIGSKVFLGAAAVSSFFKKVIIRATGQSLEEGGQGIVEETVKGVTGVRNTSVKEKVINIGYQAALGFIAGAPISAVVTKIEESGRAAGLTEEQIKELADRLVSHKDEIIDAGAVLMSKEAAGLTNDAPAREETLKAVQQVKADAVAIEETEKKADSPITALKAKTVLKANGVDAETKAAVIGLPQGFTSDDLTAAVESVKVKSAERANKTITPIMQQEVKAQQEQIAAVQNEADDITLNLQREVTALQESKEAVDPELHSMLKDISSLLKEQRQTPKPLGLIAFLKSKGGIRDQGGELEFMGMRNHAKDGARNDRKGMELDAARELAAENGYIDPDATLADFLSAVDSDFRGNPVISQADVGIQSHLDDLSAAISEIDRALGERGIGADFRKRLKELQKRVANNKKIDRAIAKEVKSKDAELHRLETQKRAIERSPPAILANKLRTFISGLRKGTYLGRYEVADVQNTLVGMIENSGLEASDRAGFIHMIKNIQTVEQLEKRLPDIVKRVERLLDKTKRSALVAHIKKTVDMVKNSNVIAVDFAKQIQSLVSEIDTSKRMPKTIESLQKTLAHLQKNPDADMPARVLKKLEILNKKRLEDVTTQDLQDISDVVDLLVQRGKLKKQLLDKQKERLKEKRIAELEASSVPLSERSTKRADIGERLSLMERIKNRYIEARNKVKQIGVSTNPMDVFFDMLDGNKGYRGANHRIFKQTIDRAFSKYLDLKESVTRDVKNLSDKFGLTEQNYEKIGAWAVLQQEGGRQKLLDSGITEDELDRLSLNEDETQMYNLMRKKLDSMLPAIQEVMRIAYNKDVVAVSDYFPFMTDHEAAKDFEIQDQLGPNVPTVRKKKNVEKGFTIARTGGTQKIRIDALGVFLRHVDNAAYLIEMGSDIKALGDVAQSKEYGQAVGDIGQEMVVEWVNLLARKGNIPGRIRVLDALRRNTGFAALGFKLSSVLIQPTSMFDGAALLGGSYASQGAVNVATSSEWRKFLWDNFPEVRERAGDDPAYLDMGGKGVVGSVREVGFWALKQVDALAASSVAAGAYTKSVEERGGTVNLSSPDPQAIQDAQLIMRRTQSSGFAKDAAPLLTQGHLTGNVSLDKLILQFQSFMLNRWSLIKHDMWALGVKQGNTKQALNAATWLIIAMAAEVGIRRLSKELLAAITGADTKPWEDTITKEAVQTALGNVPFVSQAVSSFEYGSVPVPSISVLTQVGERLQWAAQSKSPEKKARHYAEAAFILTGSTFGVPGAMQAEQVLRSSMKKEKKSKVSTP